MPLLGFAVFQLSLSFTLHIAVLHAFLSWSPSNSSLFLLRFYFHLCVLLSCPVLVYCSPHSNAIWPEINGWQYVSASGECVLRLAILFWCHLAKWHTEKTGIESIIDGWANLIYQIN